jgi:RHS repeat-associated protein
MALAVSAATNRLAGADYTYDVLGNLVTMPTGDGAGTVSMTYLDQGHIGTLTDAAGIVWKYYYDADGKRRIKVKTAGGAATEPDGQGGVRLVADHSFYFYEGEDLICQQDVGDMVQDESQYEPKFLLLDHLGTTRAELVFTESGGTFSPVIQEYYDLMPYGEIIDPPTTPENVLFNGKPRDTESGLDYFGSRYYFDQGFRWPSVDLLTFKKSYIKSPQEWNLYSYCIDNPIRFIDPAGESVYVVTYTVGNTKGDEDLRRVALTKASRIMEQKGFDPKKDKVLVKGVKTKDEFSNVLKEANSLEKSFGKVRELNLFSHSGRNQGPVFHTGNGMPIQFSKSELNELPVNWESGASASFFGCRTALSVAQDFANSQKVTSYGFEGFTYFSASPKQRVDPSSQGPLYMIDAPGFNNGGLWGLIQTLFGAPANPMVQKDPEKGGDE